MPYKYFLIITFYWQFHLIFSWRSFDFNLNEVECLRQSNVTSFLNCSIVHFNKQHQGGLWSMSLRFDREIIKPRLDMDVIAERGKRKDFVLLNVTGFNGCDFLEHKGFNLLKIIRKEFSSYSNLPSRCPVAKGTEIHVKNLTLDVNSFPSYMPETKFHVHIKLWEIETPAFDLRLHGAFTAKKRKPLF